MAVAKVIEITSASGESFEDAIREGIAKASETVRGIKGAWGQPADGQGREPEIIEDRTDLRVRFVLE